MSVISRLERGTCWTSGLGVHFKIRGDQTGGAFPIVEHQWSRM
jgi:hypothetical protein